MKIGFHNTDVVIMYAGLSSSELDALEQLFRSFDRHFDAELIVLDGSKRAHDFVEKGERLWSQDRNFAKTEGVELDITPTDTDELFNRYGEFVDRIEMNVFPRKAALDQAFYEHLDNEFCLLMHSDVVFKNADIFDDVEEMTTEIDADEFGAMGLVTSMMPLGVDKPFYGSRGDTIFKKITAAFDRITKWLIRKRHEGIGKNPWNKDKRGIRRKGLFPRLAPFFILLNRTQYVEHEMRWNPLYLDVEDWTGNSWTDWRIVGDSGASLLYQLAEHRLKVINADYENWVEHKGGTWNPQLQRINWYYIGREYEGTSQEYWRDREIPKHLLYDGPRSE